MAVSEDTTVEWDGRALVGTITINGVQKRVRATREMIHEYAPGFNDAVTWEIECFRNEIFERLKPFLIAINSGSVHGPQP
jgi:hypothetical protein